MTFSAQYKSDERITYAAQGQKGEDVKNRYSAFLYLLLYDTKPVVIKQIACCYQVVCSSSKFKMLAGGP